MVTRKIKNIVISGKKLTCSKINQTTNTIPVTSYKKKITQNIKCKYRALCSFKGEGSGVVKDIKGKKIMNKAIKRQREKSY